MWNDAVNLKKAANDSVWHLAEGRVQQELRADALLLSPHLHNIGYPTGYLESKPQPSSKPFVGGIVLQFPIRHHRESDSK